MEIRGEKYDPPSRAAGLEDVVIETPDRGQSPNGRSREANPPTIHRSQSPIRRERDLYVFHLRITCSCRSARSHLPFCAFTYQPLRPDYYVSFDLVSKARVDFDRADHYSGLDRSFNSPKWHI